MHSKYPTVLNLQARVMYLSGEADAAVGLQLKALAYFEQLEGLDSSSVSYRHSATKQKLSLYFTRCRCGGIVPSYVTGVLYSRRM